MAQYASAPDNNLPPPPKIPQDTLDALFPSAVDKPRESIPFPYPRASAESAQTLVKLLKQNHEQFHIFFNDKGFHNHTSHHLFAIYALGASPSLLEAAYEVNASYQWKAFDSPEPITDENWRDHLGDRVYYRGYLAFFSNHILKDGIASALEKFIFSTEANYVKGKADEDQPKFLDRFLSGLLHPMIHVGHGVEFNAPGMLAEGLSMASVTESHSGGLVPRDLFFPAKPSTLSSITSAFSSLSVKLSNSPHILSILARVANDPNFLPMKVYTMEEIMMTMPFVDTIQHKAEAIWKYAAEWNFDATDEKTVEEKVEELSWAVSVIYGAGGSQPGKDFSADFFLMHLVTSSIFIPSFMAYLSPSSRLTLLQTHFAQVLSTYVARGRPPLSISHFYSNSSATPTPPGPTATPHPDTLDKAHANPNPWFPLLQTTLAHPNEHLPKIQRTFAFWAAKYGARQAGYFADTSGNAEPKLDGLELLDGSFFIRAAGLTAKQLGWIREGEEKGDWGFVGAEGHE